MAGIEVWVVQVVRGWGWFGEVTTMAEGVGVSEEFAVG